MKNTNIGIANLVISNKLKESYFNNNLIEESKKLTTDFLDIVKSSPILQLEFKVFNNLDNKVIENDLIATRYIDSNIKLFEIYTIQEIEKEHEKINNFLLENVVTNLTDATYDLKRIDLYNAIDGLITESINDPDKIDVDNIHESFEIVLKHIKTPKKQLVENFDHKNVNEDVVEIAINKFNEKYEILDENDKSLFKKLITLSDDEKQELLEEYKSENLSMLESIHDDTTKEKILNAIKKIKETKYNKNTIDIDILGLHELKYNVKAELNKRGLL
jgi:hypothetical protein